MMPDLHTNRKVECFQITVENWDYHNLLGQRPINAVISMGRRNTKLEAAWH